MGRQLRRARQHRGLSLRDVHAITAIPLPCLAALEEGDLAQLPSPVYARGYVRSYAEAVRLDGDRLALELWRTLEEPGPTPDNGARTAPELPQPTTPAKKKTRPAPSSLAPLRQPISPFVPKEGRRVRVPAPRIRRHKAGRLNLKPKHRRSGGQGRFSRLAPALERTAIVVLVLVLAAGVWGLVRGNPSTDTKSATKASAVNSSIPRSSPSSSPSSVPPTTVPAPPPATPASDTGNQATYAIGRTPFTVAITAKDAPLWIQVRAGARGAQLFMGTLQPGETKPFPTAGVLWVRVGNVAHSSVTVDGGQMALPPKPAVPYNLLFQK
jgi:cytoskeleton protein RodZ